MSDITSLNSGYVDDSDQVNWRGDQVSLPQGGQSVYNSSSVKLASLGSRKVVGDRVFRYALAAGTAKAGDVIESQPQYDVAATAGAVAAVGAKVVSVYCITATIAKNAFADGSLFVESGSSCSGMVYKVKSHEAVTTGTSVSYLKLYDPIKVSIPVADKVGVQAHKLSGVVQATTAIAHVPVGVTPVAVASGDYFWLQTWGPASCRGGTLLIGEPVTLLATGAVGPWLSATVGTGALTGAIIGNAMMACTASHNGLVYLTIDP